MGDPNAKVTYFRFHQEPARISKPRDQVCTSSKPPDRSGVTKALGLPWMLLGCGTFWDKPGKPQQTEPTGSPQHRVLLCLFTEGVCLSVSSVWHLRYNHSGFQPSLPHVVLHLTSGVLHGDLSQQYDNPQLVPPQHCLFCRVRYVTHGAHPSHPEPTTPSPELSDPAGMRRPHGFLERLSVAKHPKVFPLELQFSPISKGLLLVGPHKSASEKRG